MLFKTLGRMLVFQMSQRVPVIEYYPEYAWSHPVEKGGWTSHDADITPFNDKSKDAAKSMACETYRVLQEYHKRNFNDKQRIQDCSSILADVLKFVEANTKDGKHKWFLAHGFSPKAAANSSDYLSLPGPNPGRGDEYINLSTSATSRERFKKYSVAKFVENLLHAWIVEKNFRGTIDAFFDLDEIAFELASLGYTEFVTEYENPRQRSLSYEPLRQWTEGFLRLWLLEDHSSANKVRHGMDAERGNALFRNIFTEDQQMTFSSLKEAIEWKGSEQYQIIPLDHEKSPLVPGKSYAVVFRFMHAPRDVVILVIKSSSPFDWHVTRIFSIVAG